LQVLATISRANTDEDMAVIVANCPRCKSKNMTFDVLADVLTGIKHDWQAHHELFGLCRNCLKPTIWVIAQSDYHASDFLKKNPSLAKMPDSLNNYFRVDAYICIKDMGVMDAPEHVPDVIAKAFREGATGVVTNCPNAAGAMFRLVIDLTTRPMLPTEETPGLTTKVRRDLGLRLPWLFDNGFLPNELRDLSHCIREDGNDGAHAGTLTNNGALDLQDFCVALLERIFTEPGRLRLAAERRAQRRAT
jgi:hypothetical protein